MKLIADLGLRYPPAAGADEQGRAALLVLLGGDVAEVPVGVLERAIDRWVVSKPFMPKASELLALSREIAASDLAQWRMDGETIAQRRNWTLWNEGKTGGHWEGVGGDLYITSGDVQRHHLFSGRL